MTNRLLFGALAACLPVFALSNAVTVQETSGSTQTNRVLTIPRYFAQDEICGYARPYSGGAAMTYWQVDVKTRWIATGACPGGSVRIALVTVEIPSLTANGTISIEFRSDAASSSSGSGLTKTQMLNFDTGGGAGSWGAGWTATTGGVTMTCRAGSAIPCGARDMLTNDHYQVLESGPLRMSILVREGPDAVSAATTRTTSVGWQCTAACVAPYDTATWANNSAYYSIRSSYVLTFYSPHTGTGKVEVDFLLDNGWLDRAQDQRVESIELDTGGAETTSCYTNPAAFVLPFRSRMFETCWNGGAPGAVNIDFNRAYIMYSKLLPSYGLNYVLGTAGIALEVGTGPGTQCTSGLCSFLSSDQGATTNTTIAPLMGWGQDADRGGPTGGSSPIIGFLNRWTSRYVNSFDSGLMNAVLGNAKAQMHAPIFWLENSTTSAYLTGNSAKGFGKIVTLDARPTLQASAGSGTTAADWPRSPHGDPVCNSGNNAGCPATFSTCAAPNCMVTGLSTGGSSTPNYMSVYDSGTVSKWAFDASHSRDQCFIPYLTTGKYVYLECVQAMGQIALMLSVDQGSPTTPSIIYSRWGSRGLIYSPGNTIRGSAWPMRNLGMAALISNDGSVEKQYFTLKLNNNIESHEGRFGITDGSFSPLGSTCTANSSCPASTSCSGFNINTETSIWRMSRCYYENGYSNPLWMTMRQRSTDGNVCEGCDGSQESSGESPWMAGYFSEVNSQLADWGFGASAIHKAMAQHFLHMFGDSAYLAKGLGPAEAIQYRMPTNVAGTVGSSGYIQTWAAARAAHLESTTLARPLLISDTEAYPLDFGGNTVHVNWLDGASRDGTYWKVDSEIILVTDIGCQTNTACSNPAFSATISSVNTSTDQFTTSSAHNLTEGWRILLFTSSTPDSGLTGNTNCRAENGGSTRNNNCSFYVHVIDATTVQLYNDAAMTSRLHLNGDGVSEKLWQGHWFITRAQLGTTAASHSLDAVVRYWPVIVPPSRMTNPDSHAYFYTTALADAATRRYSVTDEGNGSTLNAQAVFNALDAITTNSNIAGANRTSCSGYTIVNCDVPTWGIRPRPLINDLQVTPSGSSVTFQYTAPDSNACKYAVSASAFASTDDSGDTSDGQSASSRSVTVSGLTPGANYVHRLTCGPSGGAARLTSLFTAAPTGGTKYAGRALRTGKE